MASRGKTAQLNHMWVADFETCDSDELSKYTVDGQHIMKQRVWLAGLKNLQTKTTQVFTDIDSFMVEVLSRGNNQNKEIAIHNLKFDGSYIVPWLLNNGYNSTNERPQAKEFGVLVTDRNDWYSITIQVTKRRKVTFWDTAKLFPMKLEYMSEVYYTPTQKLIEDSEFYERKRELDHTPTDEELSYLENDLQVMVETLEKHIERYGLRFKKTQAGQAWYDFTQGFKAWKLRFPALDNEQDEFIRPAYWGGVSYVPEQYAGKDVYNIGVMDINSSYPDKAANYKMPYGSPLFKTKNGHPDMSKFWIGDLHVRFKLKPHKIPCIPSKAITEGLPIGVLNVDKWLRKSYGVMRITMSSIDYVTAQMSYDFEVIRWNEVVHYKQRVHPEIREFVNRNDHIKTTAKADAVKLPDSDPRKFSLLADSQRAKINNNSFYGKFGEEVIKEGKTPYKMDDGDVEWLVDKVQELTDGKRKYLPVAIAITAYGRQQLVELGNALGKYFLYSDTDSVHYLFDGGQEIIDDLVENGKLDLHPTKLGAWDVEGFYERGRFLRPKAYMEDDEVTLAGLPADPHTGQFSKERSAITWENFHLGYVVPKEETNKLRSLRTETGIKLLPTDFSIKDHENNFILGNISEKEQTQIMLDWEEEVMGEIDLIKDTVKEHGYIKTILPDEQYHYEYTQLPHGTKIKYFRKDGTPLDVVAMSINLNANQLMEKIGGN